VASLTAYFNVQQFADNGDPLASGRLYTYAAGTTTQKTAYTDAAGLIPQTYTSDGLGGQYIALNSRGELPAPLFLSSGGYDIALKRADGSSVWTRRANGIDDASDTLRTDLASYTNAAKGSALVGFDTDLAYPANTAGRSLKAVRSILEDGTVDGTGATACSAAINALIAGGGEWVFPAGTYLLDASIPLADSTILRFQSGATIKPAANSLTLFTSKDYSGTKHSYFTQIHSPYFDANGKTGVVCFDLYGLRHAAGIFFPKFIGAFDHCIKLTELCWDCVIDEPFAQGCVNGILIGHGSNAVQIRKPGIDGLGSAGYGIKTIGGASYPTTSNSVIGGYIQGFSGVGGVGCWDSGAGTTFGVYGTTYDHVYFELNEFADIYFDTSYYGRAIGCEHYVTFGRNANYGRYNVGVRVERPMMTSGSRSIGLYNFDTSNRNSFGDKTVDVATGLNIPLGTVSGIGDIPTEEYGDFPGSGVVVESTGGVSTGITYTTRLARWHRIGRRVNITAQVQWTGWTGPAGNILIKGAPAALVPSSYTPTGVGTVIGLMAWTGASLVCYLNGTSTNIAIIQNTTAGAINPLAMTAAGSLVIDLSYTL